MWPGGPSPFSPGHWHGHTPVRLLEALGTGVRSCCKSWQEQRVGLQGEESERVQGEETKSKHGLKA